MCVSVHYLRSLYEFQKTRSKKMYNISSLQNIYHALPNNLQIETLDIYQQPHQNNQPLVDIIQQL